MYIWLFSKATTKKKNKNIFHLPSDQQRIQKITIFLLYKIVYVINFSKLFIVFFSVYLI